MGRLVPFTARGGRLALAALLVAFIATPSIMSSFGRSPVAGAEAAGGLDVHDDLLMLTSLRAQKLTSRLIKDHHHRRSRSPK